MSSFINIAARTEFSFKKMLQPISAVVNGSEVAVGIADLNSTYGHPLFRKACIDNGVKPIFGLRVMAVVDVSARPKNPGQFGHTYIVLAKNSDGLKEINRLVKTAYDNFYYRPIVGLKHIFELSDSVVVIAENFIVPERVDYIGLSFLTNLSLLRKHEGIPRVALQSNSYKSPQDRVKYELFLGGRLMDSRPFPQHELTEKEWLNFFGDKEAIKNTALIAESCNADMKSAPPVKYLGRETIDDIVAAGLIEKGIELTDHVKERIKLELELIKSKEYADYFMIVYEMVREAKKKMLVGPGRGSAGGSIVCYLMGITEVNPMEFGLLFERFLDKNRHDMPDIDLDFPDKHRDKVIKALEAANGGSEHVSHLSTISRLRGDSLINHVGKELELPFEDTAALKESLIKRPGGDTRVNFCVIDTLVENDTGREFAEKHPEVLLAAEFEGHATHYGVHAAGILVCNDPITDYVGVNSKDNAAMIDYREAEWQNLLKIDVLGLRTLTILQETAELAGFDYLSYYSLDLNDEKALEIFRSKRLTGIFQFEGGALSSLCGKISVRNFNDIASLTALGRPGPLHGGGTDKFVARHNGIEDSSPLVDFLPVTEILKETYGVIVYQEQLMHICRAVGMSWEDTSGFRRVVAKRKGLELLNTYKKAFEESSHESGMSRMSIAKLWNEMVTFGEYGFNKSHAVAYAMISYHCAWAKAHHPLEFAVASLNNSKSSDSAVRLLRDFVTNDKLHYTPVDPDESDVMWSVSNGELLGGLTNIDGIGVSKARTIIKNRRLGRPDSPSIMKKLVSPETDFDILFPAKHFFGDMYEHFSEYGLEEPPTFISDINCTGEYTFIGKLIDKKVKDLNDPDKVEKRGGSTIDGESMVLNMTLEDDTGQIMGRISRFDFSSSGRVIIEKDEEKGRKDAHWYIVKGSIIDDSMRFVFINKIHYLGEHH